jgi:hypothetical protein
MLRRLSYLLLSLFICFALASFCFWQNLELKELHPIWGELLLHLAIAFVVAGTITGVLEFQAQRLAEREAVRFRKQVSRDVFQALFGKIVPKEVFAELNDVLHSPIVRRDCKYRITFRPPDPGMPRDYFIIRREVTYEVENLLSQPISFVARSSHSEDLDLSAAGWKKNFHSDIFVNGKKLPLIEGENFFVEGTAMRIAHSLMLPSRGSATIAFHGEEPSRVSAGRNSYLQATPVIGMEVDVINDYKDAIEALGVQMNHPAAPEPTPNQIGRYLLERAFLPGQGFQVRWREKRQAETRGETEQGGA